MISIDRCIRVKNIIASLFHRNVYREEVVIMSLYVSLEQLSEYLWMLISYRVLFAIREISNYNRATALNPPSSLADYYVFVQTCET